MLMALMSMDICERQMGLPEIYRKLGEAEKQLEEGVPLLSGDEVFQRLRERCEK